MPNIFDGLKKVSDDEIIEQIALLETMNISNISKPIAQKAKKKTISIINYLGTKLGKANKIEEPEVKEIWTLVQEKENELKSCTRDQLNGRLFDVLIEKTKSDLENPTEDEISVAVIDEVAKLYKFRENSTPNQKADRIYLKYYEKIQGKAKEYLKEQEFIELKETTKSVEDILNSMDEEQRKDIEQAVDVEKLTLLNAWKKVDRQLFVKIVWLAVKAYGGKFTVNREMLPSYLEKDEATVADKEELELDKSKKEVVELKNNLDIISNKINSIENSLKEESELLNNIIKKSEQAKDDIMILEESNINLEETTKIKESKLKELKEQMDGADLAQLDILMEEFKKLKFEVIDINNKISDIKIDIEYKNQFIKDSKDLVVTKEESLKNLSKEIEEVKIEKENLVKIYKDKKEVVNKKEILKRNKIFEKWSNYFNKFTFAFEDLGNVIDFSRDQILHIEECLYELHFTKDPMALSMGLIKEKDNKERYPYIDVRFSEKFEIEIQYKVLDEKEKDIHIIEITTEL